MTPKKPIALHSLLIKRLRFEACTMPWCAARGAGGHYNVVVADLVKPQWTASQEHTMV